MIVISIRKNSSGTDFFFIYLTKSSPNASDLSFRPVGLTYNENALYLVTIGKVEVKMELPSGKPLPYPNTMGISIHWSSMEDINDDIECWHIAEFYPELVENPLNESISFWVPTGPLRDIFCFK